MSLPQSHVLLVESVHSIDHLLDELHLAVAQAVFVGDVVRHAGLAAALSPGAAWLEVELLTPSSQHLGAQLGPAWREGCQQSTQVVT